MKAMKRQVEIKDRPTDHELNILYQQQGETMNLIQLEQPDIEHCEHQEAKVFICDFDSLVGAMHIAMVANPDDHFLHEFVDIYRDATELQSNPPETFTAKNLAGLESVRHNALYQIAVLLELPNLPRPSQPLSREQLQQCLQFISDREVKPCL
jgi:hypothetical protein